MFCIFLQKSSTINFHLHLFQVGKIMSIILLIWLISLLAVLPIFFATKLQQYSFVGTDIVIKEICKEEWPQPSLHLLYSVILMIVQVHI